MEKSNLIRLAVATALAGASAQSASALDISTWTSGSPTVNVYIGGSTAVDNDIYNVADQTIAPGGLCTAGSIDVYYVGTVGSYTQRMIFCTGNAASGVSGSPIAIFKESTAGSINGVLAPYSYAKTGVESVSFLDAATLKAAGGSTLCTTGAGGGTGGQETYTTHFSCPVADITTSIVPTGGFADVENAILKTTSDGSPPADAGTFLSSDPTVDQIWAVALTKNAYYALQTLEGYATGDNPANAASLSKEDVASIISEDIFQWSDIGLAPADNNVYVCRRDDGSGTEGSFEAYFLGERCSKSDQSVPAEDAATVWANASGGAMRTCLQHMYVGGTQTAYYSTKTHTFVNGAQYAIGFLNDEITLSNLTGASDSFRIVAVDGAGPTVANVQNGVYPYFSTGVGYSIKSGNGVLSGNAKTVWNNIINRIGHPAFVAATNGTYNGVLPWSPTLSVGDAAPAEPAYLPAFAIQLPSSSAMAATNPTNQWTKNPSTNGVNNCDTPVWDSNDLSGTVTAFPQSKSLGTLNENN